MSLIKHFILLFLFISLSCHNLRGISIPDKDSFIPLKHGEKTYIELTPTKRELYFSFDNQFDDSDIAIYTKFAHQYTVGMYIYDAYEKIKTDEQGEYIETNFSFDLAEKFNYFNQSKKCTYYIIIKDSGNYTSKDYITIFNEKDTLQLKEDDPFLIRMFFKNNLYTFSFSGEADDKIEIDMNINDDNYGESIIIKRDNEEVHKSISNKGIIQLNKDNKKGNYKIYLSAISDTYTDIKASLVLRKTKNEVRLIEPEKELNLYYGYTKEFSFYLNLDDYELNDENIITFKVSHFAYRNKLVQYCYAKNMNFEKFDDNKLISNMPCREEESESSFNRLNSYDTIYHLYFARTKAKEENKKSFLLVHCSFKSEDDIYYDPELISINLSNKPTLLDFTDPKKINQKIKIKEYIPMIYKINIPIKELPEDNKYSYVFYTNLKIQAVYANSMLKANYNKEETYQLYAISNTQLKKEKEKKNKIYYIKIFGAEQEINFRAEVTEAEIYFNYGNYRYSRTLTEQRFNCGTSLYFIGSYSVVATELFFFLEEIYGKYDIYYRNEITENDDDTILTNSNDKYLVKGKSFALSKTFDIIELKCQSPGYFNLHQLKNTITDTLVLYQRQIAVVNKGELEISLENVKDIKNVNLEISTPLGKEINIKTYDTTINSEKRYFQIEYNEDTFTNTCLLYIQEDNTIISLKLTDEQLYQVVDKDFDRTNEQFILFKLENNKNYKNVNITVDKISNYYAYTLFKGDINYGYDITNSGIKTIAPDKTKNNINLILSNPYTKINPMISDKEDSPFYVLFYVKDTEGKQKDLYVVYNNKDEYEEWKNTEIKTLPSDENKKYDIKVGKDIQKLSVLYQSCGKSLKEINIYNYDDVLNNFKNNNKVNLGIFNNYEIDKQLGPIFVNDPDNKYPGAQVSLSLKEIPKEEIDNLNNATITYISQNGTKLNWANLKGAKEYTIYVFNSQNENVKYIENICYLKSIKKTQLNNELKDETDPTYIGIYTTTSNSFEVKEKGVYYITVVANLENNYPLNYVFNEIKYNSSEPSPQPGPGPDDNPKSNTLAIVLGICIPLVIIITVIVVIFIVKKKRNQDIEQNLPDDDAAEALVRPTTTSSTA